VLTSAKILQNVEGIVSSCKKWIDVATHGWCWGRYENELISIGWILSMSQSYDDDTVPTVKIDPTIILTQLSAGFFFDPYNLIGGLMQGKD
jgi:hypothetical protein